MSWIEISETSHFPINNLPYGIFSRKNDQNFNLLPFRHIGVAIGSYVLDLSPLYHAGIFRGLHFDTKVLLEPNLNAFMSLNRNAWIELRHVLIHLLDNVTTDPRLRENRELQEKALIPMEKIDLHLPAVIGDYTDFYSSREHATNIGIMLRGKENALQPNWLHLPVGYHGRSSSVVISGTDVIRPYGQILADSTDPSKGPIHHPTKALDFELEMAFFVGGSSNMLGSPITMAEAEERIFGVVLMNDWSARDVQAWEYVPLGPFTAKNFCTSISPWVVPMEALQSFRCMSSAGESQNPTPLSYLYDPNYSNGSYDVQLEVQLKGEKDVIPSIISKSNLKYMYWNFKQQLVHHSVSGCNIRPGDLLATGTISGSTDDSLGSLMELSWRGSREVHLSNAVDSTDSTRKYLKDGDTLILTGYAQGNGCRIGFGEVSGKILPAGTQTTMTTILSSEPTSMVLASGISDVKLYSYWRSSSSHRVRIALELKAISYTYIPMNLQVLVGNVTESLPEVFATKNPQEQVPVLEFIQPDGTSGYLAQSVAIIEYLDEVVPGPISLLPKSSLLRAKARQLVELINSGIQPFQNTGLARQVKMVQLIESPYEVSDAAGLAMSYVRKGLHSVEELIKELWKDEYYTDRFALGTTNPTVADIFLIPQIYSAKRFNIDLSAYPRCMQVFSLAESLSAFIAAAPINQPDAIKT